MNFKILLSCVLFLAFITQDVTAQKEETKKRKMTIVTKTVDKDGKETITTVVKEGDEVSDEEIEKLLKEHGGKTKTIDVEVNVEDEKTEKIIIKEKGGKEIVKEYKIIQNGEEIEVEGDGEHNIFMIDDEDGYEKEIRIIKKKGSGDEDIIIKKIGEEKDAGNNKMIFIGEDGEVQEMENGGNMIIKKTKGKDGEIHIEVQSGDDSNKMIFIDEDGEVQEMENDGNTIIKKTKGKDGEIHIEVQSGGDSDEMIWIEKMEGEKGDVIIIEEETIEEKDKDGKTIKKTVKKTKKIKKKEDK